MKSAREEMEKLALASRKLHEIYNEAPFFVVSSYSERVIGQFEPNGIQSTITSIPVEGDVNLIAEAKRTIKGAISSYLGRCPRLFDEILKK